MTARHLAAVLAVSVPIGCHLVGGVDDVSFVDDVRCLQADDCGSGECQIPTCQDGRCGVVNVPGGETCQDGVCDGQGLCLVCQVDGDCASGRCLENQCVADSCDDGVKGGDETGVDCGGACVPCAEGQPCNTGQDCVGASCVGDVCAACKEGSCPEDRYCDDETGACELRKPYGAECDEDRECIEGADCENDVCDD